MENLYVEDVLEVGDVEMELTPEEMFKESIFEHTENSIKLAANSPETEDYHGLKPEVIIMGGPFSGDFSRRFEQGIYNELLINLKNNGFNITAVFVKGQKGLKITW